MQIKSLAATVALLIVSYGVTAHPTSIDGVISLMRSTLPDGSMIEARCCC